MATTIKHPHGGTTSSVLHQKSFVPSRPVITSHKVDQLALRAICPVHAIGVNPTRIDLGRCVFCRACEDQFPDKIKFTSDTVVATNIRERLIVLESDSARIAIDPALVRNDIKRAPSERLSFLILGDSTIPNATSFGITIVNEASSAHGIIVMNNLDEETQNAIEQHYTLLLNPKIIIVAGSEAVSSPLFSDETGNAMIKHKIPVDLFIPGDPFLPNTLAAPIQQLIQTKN